MRLKDRHPRVRVPLLSRIRESTLRKRVLELDAGSLQFVMTIRLGLLTLSFRKF
jgi:hypothetical protein